MPRRYFFGLLALASLWTFSNPVRADQLIPPAFTVKMNAIPDQAQTDPSANFPHGGVHLCGPCAVSNSMVWLSDHGYRKLVPEGNGGKTSQIDLVRLLGSDRYVGTTMEKGSSPEQIMLGVSRFLKDRGYDYERMQYQGWRQHSAQFSTGVTTPDLNWIKAGMLGNSAVWLNLGWYLYDEAKREYRRTGGHWVTMVGYGVDEHGTANDSVLIVHDPFPRNGMAPSNDYLHLERINDDAMIQSREAPPGGISAKGQYRLTRGIAMKTGARALLDGAIILHMAAPDRVEPPTTISAEPATRRSAS
ncbi:MAG: hypothetical protein ACLGPL_03570 [Acidobacteriota bacterium]